VAAAVDLRAQSRVSGYPREERMRGESALCTGGAEGVAVALDGELGEPQVGQATGEDMGCLVGWANPFLPSSPSFLLFFPLFLPTPHCCIKVSYIW